MQPGIVVDNVLVAVDEKFSEPLALIDLFGFKGEKTSSSSTYMGKKGDSNGDSFHVRIFSLV